METNVVNTAAVQGAELTLSLWPWGILTAIAAFVCSMMIQRMAVGIALSPLWRAASEHWTEKARLSYPGQTALISGQILQAFLWAIIGGSVWINHRSTLAPLMAFCAFIGAGIASARLESRMRERPVSMRDWSQNWTVLILTFMPWLLVFMIMSWCLPAKFNWTALWIILTAAGGVLALSFGAGIAVVRWIGLLRPPPPRLQAIVDSAVQRMAVRPPTVYLLRWKMANALAFPFDRAIAVTDMALNSFTDEELVAICSHELAHLNEPRRFHFARLAGEFAWMPFFLLGPLTAMLGFANAFLIAFAVFFISQQLVQRMSRTMERQADSAGMAHEGDSGTYARALEKLHQINLIPAVMRSNLLSHPHLYDRMIASGIQPDYPRPQPPSRWRAKVALVFMLLGALICAFLWLVFAKAVQT